MALYDEVNRFVLVQLKGELTDAQKDVLYRINELLWNYVNTVNE